MKVRIIMITLLLATILGATSALADLQVSEQAISFDEVTAAGYRFCYAIIDMPDHAAEDWRAVDIHFTTDCSEALGELGMGLVSLWDQQPQDWTDILAPEHTRMGLFFRAEGEGEHKAEIASSFATAGLAGQSAVLVFAFDCRDVDCRCEPLIEGATLRFTIEETDGP